VEALVHSENRLQAIAIVHEKLYKSDNFTSVLLKDYLQELMDVLANQHSNPATPFQFKITDNTKYTTNLDTAIPIGLIVNELVTNSFKYAFNNVATGTIDIELNKTHNNYQLTIQDNGQGLPNGELPKNPKSLGLRLVQLFTEQLNGSLKYNTNKGACFRVVFA
jgi:two-component sensor histidine kinase